AAGAHGHRRAGADRAAGGRVPGDVQAGDAGRHPVPDRRVRKGADVAVRVLPGPARGLLRGGGVRRHPGGGHAGHSAAVRARAVGGAGAVRHVGGGRALFGLPHLPGGGGDPRVVPVVRGFGRADHADLPAFPSGAAAGPV
ncbi:MAG: hypothetical protein AVDCRST_MAG89-3599, partial [uncultured Gemmatimonadetes bacterium]